MKQRLTRLEGHSGAPCRITGRQAWWQGNPDEEALQ